MSLATDLAELVVNRLGCRFLLLRRVCCPTVVTSIEYLLFELLG